MPYPPSIGPDRSPHRSLPRTIRDPHAKARLGLRSPIAAPSLVINTAHSTMPEGRIPGPMSHFQTHPQKPQFSGIAILAGSVVTTLINQALMKVRLARLLRQLLARVLASLPP